MGTLVTHVRQIQSNTFLLNYVLHKNYVKSNAMCKNQNIAFTISTHSEITEIALSHFWQKFHESNSY